METIQLTHEKPMRKRNDVHRNGATLVVENSVVENSVAQNDVAHHIELEKIFVPEAVYWEKYYEHENRYEWNDGYLEMKPMSDYVKFLAYRWFCELVWDYLHVYPIARMIGLEVGFRLRLPKKTKIRKPDLGIVLHSNPVPLGDHDRFYRGRFDICIESLSDSNQGEIDRDTKVKKREYAQAGVPEYYILDDRAIETKFYQLGPRGFYVPIPPSPERIICSRVLPGFQFRPSDLYLRPTPPQMMDDPVYSGFVSPYLRAERQRTEQEFQHAEQERFARGQAEERAEQDRLARSQAEERAEQDRLARSQAEERAEQERQGKEAALSQVERYKAHMRSLGIDPE